MDVTWLSRISLSLENNENNSLVTLSISLASQPRTERSWQLTMKWTLILLFYVILKQPVLTGGRKEHKN